MGAIAPQEIGSTTAKIPLRGRVRKENELLTANPSVMRRWATVLVVAALTLSVPGAAGALPPPPTDLEQTVCARTNEAASHAFFEVSGPGASAFVGGWVVEEGNAWLCFRGAGGLGGATSVVALWTTPWVRPREGEFGYDFEYTTANPLADVPWRIESRIRAEGGEWTDWAGFKRSSRPLAEGGFGGSEQDIVVLGPSWWEPPLMQWQWRVRMDVPAASVVDMQVSISAH